MAALTTTRAGDFYNTTGGVTPWAALTGAGPGGVPGTGDTVTFGHAVTAAPSASSLSLGTGSGTAVTFSSGGSWALTPQGAFTLTLAGATAGGRIAGYEFTATSTNGAITINIDATGAGAGFAMVTGGTYDPSNLGGWNLVGNATYGITVASLPSDASKNSYFSYGSNGGGGVVNAAYTTFRRIGVANTTAGYSPALDNRVRTLSWDHVTLDACGEVTLSGDASYSGTITFADVTSTNTATNASTKYPLNASFALTGTRTFTRCSWDKTIKLTHMRGCSFLRNYFHNGWAGTDVTSVWGGMDVCFIRTTFDNLVTSGSLTNSFIFWDAPGGSNPHFVSGTTNPTGTVTFNWSNNIAYYNGTDAAGNVFLPPITSNANLSYTINGNLILPNSAGSNSGALVTGNGVVAGGFSITANHNTVFCKGQHAFEIGHLYTSVESPNRYVSVKSNLFVGGGTGYKAYNVDNTTTTDLMPPSVVDYNGSYQIKATSGNPNYLNEGKGYAARWSVMPGAHDVDDVDPGFVNGSASLATWAVSMGSTGSTLADKEADALTYVKADLSTRIDAVNAYLASAYRVTATAFHGTAHDGGDIGAFAWVSLGGVPYGDFSSLSGGFHCMTGF